MGWLTWVAVVLTCVLTVTYAGRLMFRIFLYAERHGTMDPKLGDLVFKTVWRICVAVGVAAVFVYSLCTEMYFLTFVWLMIGPLLIGVGECIADDL